MADNGHYEIREGGGGGGRDIVWVNSDGASQKLVSVPSSRIDQLAKALGLYVMEQWAATMDLMAGLPDARSICQYCELVIEWSQGRAWSSAQGPGLTGRITECPGHPGEESDPIPGHKPGRVSYRPEYLERH